MELTSDPAAAADVSSSNSHLHDTDDRTIDGVMARLMAGYLANDYSYSFDVMYAPLLDSMGGREKIMAMLPALKEQAKQMRISVISWAPKKPYTYLRGKGRWYAVIPCVSEMSMTGQKVKISSFWLGIKNDGAEWQFVGGEKIIPAVWQNFFPDFPKDFEVPKTQRQIE